MLDAPRWVRRGAVVAAALFCLQFRAQAQHEAHFSPTAAAPDRPATHGMLVFGTKRVYASHLPMYHAPHHYQLVVELVLSDSARAAYAASQRAYPQETVYTLEPERFVLPDLVAHPRPFRATLYRGHFERGGTPIARQQLVRLRRTLCFRPLDTAQPTATRAPYLLIGGPHEQFLVHRIEGRPDFDQVLRVQMPDALARRQLRASDGLSWLRTGANDRQPLPASGPVSGTLAPTARPVQFTVRQLYLEFDDLK